MKVHNASWAATTCCGQRMLPWATMAVEDASWLQWLNAASANAELVASGRLVVLEPPAAENAAETGAATDPAPTPPANPDKGQGDAPGGAGGASDAAALQRVKGIGPSVADKLVAAGVTSLAALAALTDEQFAALPLPPLQRSRAASWRDQAKTLAADAG